MYGIYFDGLTDIVAIGQSSLALNVLARHSCRFCCAAVPYLKLDILDLYSQEKANFTAFSVIQST